MTYNTCPLYSLQRSGHGLEKLHREPQGWGRGGGWRGSSCSSLHLLFSRIAASSAVIMSPVTTQPNQAWSTRYRHLVAVQEAQFLQGICV